MTAKKANPKKTAPATPGPGKKHGFLAFGAGLAVGVGAALLFRARSPRGAELLNAVMQKLGIEWGEILLALWDPEAHQPVAEAPPTKMASAGKISRKRSPTPTARPRKKFQKSKVAQRTGKSKAARRRRRAVASLEIVA